MYELDLLRKDATAALADDDALADPDLEGGEWPALDATFANFFETREPSSMFGEALLLLAEEHAWPEAPAGAAAASAGAAVADTASTVRALFESAGSSGRSLMVSAEAVLRLPRKVIDLLFDRPAATLLHEDPVAVSDLAQAVGVPLERVLQAVAASSRRTAGSTYGYRPRLASGAERGEEGDRRDALRASTLDWGARLLALRPADSP
jgi:hypothetical protein